MRLVDLSVPLSSGMGHFEGTPPVYICKSHRIDECGYRMSLLVLGNHSGTHLDAPSHFVEEGEGLDAVPLERCIGPAVVLDFSAKAPNEPITVSDLEAHADEIVEGARILLRTDWDRRFGEDAYFAEMSALLDTPALRDARRVEQQALLARRLDLDHFEGELKALRHMAYRRFAKRLPVKLKTIFPAEPPAARLRTG